jgi:hypothetical protein
MSQVQKISNRNFWVEWGWNKFTAKTFSVDSGEVRKVLVMMGIFSPCFACLSSTSFLRCCNLVSQTCMAQLSDHMSIWFLFTTLYGLSLYFQVMRNLENISKNENYIMEKSNECSKTLRKHIEDAYNEVLIQTPRRRRNICYSPDITGGEVHHNLACLLSKRPCKSTGCSRWWSFITTLLAQKRPANRLAAADGERSSRPLWPWWGGGEQQMFGIYWIQTTKPMSLKTMFWLQEIENSCREKARHKRDLVQFSSFLL